MIARHVQHAALLVHAHDAEVAGVSGVVSGLLGLLCGLLEVFTELLLDLEEGGLLVDEVLEEGGGLGGRGGLLVIIEDEAVFVVAVLVQLYYPIAHLRWAIIDIHG